MEIVNVFAMKSHELQLLLSEGAKHQVLDAPEPSGPRIQKVRRIFPGWLRAGQFSMWVVPMAGSCARW
jgi:hypothetical protein